MKLALLFCLVLVISGCSTAQLGNDQGNGGDDVALEFHKSFVDGVRELAASHDELKAVLENSLASSAAVQIIVVDKSIDVTVQKILQDSVAINFPEQSLIFINRFRWNAIDKKTIKQSIALHEYLSLAGVESSGHYQISSLILNQKPGLGALYRIGCEGRQYWGIGKCEETLDSCRTGDTDLGLAGCQWRGAMNGWNVYSCERICATGSTASSGQHYSRFASWVQKPTPEKVAPCRSGDLDLGVLCASTVIWDRHTNRNDHGGNCERQCLSR